MDECASLPSKVLVPDFHYTYGHDSYNFAVFTQSPPLRFSFGQEPDFLYTVRRGFHSYPVEVAPETRQCHDIVRHIHLGVKPCEPIRECIHCGACSLLQSTARSTLTISWEKRFVKSCMCGGHWKLRTREGR